MTHLVVFEVRRSTSVVWAWCLLRDGGPGFQEVAFTEADGITPLDAPGEHVPLGKFLFTVTADFGATS